MQQFFNVKHLINLKRYTMKANNTIYLSLEIVSIIIGVLVIIASIIPGVLEISHAAQFNFDVADFFLWGFLAGTLIMVAGALIFDSLDNKYNQ